MRLEHDYHASMPELARTLDGGAHLCRVVTVVVVDGRALEDAQELEPPMRAGKSLERRRDVGEAHTDLDRHRRRRGRVGDVVPASLAQVDATELPALMCDGEGSLAAAAVIRRFGEAVGHLPRGRRQGDGAFVVR